jgi:hypothetical protein
MTERPEDLLSRGPVTLRRYREDDLDVLVQAVSESEDHLGPWLPWVAGAQPGVRGRVPGPGRPGLGVRHRL